MYFFISFAGKCNYNMDTTEIPNVEILEINSDNVKRNNSAICLEQNGFLLCKHGCIVLMMDDNSYKVTPGDLYIYPAFSQTYIHSVSDDFQGVIGRADFDFVLSSLDSIADTQSHVYIRFHPLVSLSDTQYRCISKLIEGIQERKEIQTSLKTQVIGALIHAFCFEVVDAYITNYKEQIQSKKQTRRDKIFQSFLISLHHNFRQHREVGFYAEQLHLTPRYFSTIIHNISGKTPVQWIILFVITEAKRLLSKPEISIKETAYRLNFSDQSFFGRYFKQYAGYSPSQYKSYSANREKIW